MPEKNEVRSVTSRQPPRGAQTRPLTGSDFVIETSSLLENTHVCAANQDAPSRAGQAGQQGQAPTVELDLQSRYPQYGPHAQPHSLAAVLERAAAAMVESGAHAAPLAMSSSILPDHPAQASPPEPQALRLDGAVPPFPLNALHHIPSASALSNLEEFESPSDHVLVNGPIRPGYATPMRSSVVDMMPLVAQHLSATPDAESPDAASFTRTSAPNTQEISSMYQSSPLSSSIMAYRARNAARTEGDETIPSPSSPSGPYLAQRPPLLRQAVSAVDGLRAATVVRDIQQANAEIPWEEIAFSDGPAIGDGNEGNVLLASYKGYQVAVKTGTHERIVKEHRLMANLRHPNVVRTMGHAKRGAGSPMDPVHYAAVYEYCANKDLMTYLANSHTRTDVARMTQIFDDILAGLEYVHGHGSSPLPHAPIVHGDVKPENVMIDADGRAKLGDFGLAQYQTSKMDVQGTPSYIAPEVVLDFVNNAARPNFTTKSDIFSFGVLMVVALTGHYPFKRLTAKLHGGGMTTAQVIKHFTPGRKPLKMVSELSPRFRRMIDACLCRYPEMRPSASQLRQHLFRRSRSDPHTVEEPTAALPLNVPAPDTAANDAQDNNLNKPIRPASLDRVPPSLAGLFEGENRAAPAAIPVSSGKLSSD